MIWFILSNSNIFGYHDDMVSNDSFGERGDQDENNLRKLFCVMHSNFFLEIGLGCATKLKEHNYV